jgi:hypothetical protein
MHSGSARGRHSGQRPMLPGAPRAGTGSVGSDADSLICAARRAPRTPPENGVRPLRDFAGAAQE